MKDFSTSDCPITKVAAILSDTWTILIMHALADGPKRFCELEAALGGISTRTLTLKLQKLTATDMITKNEAGYYEATQKGSGLKMIEQAMLKYSAKYLE